jgi:hypothetical protein
MIYGSSSLSSKQPATFLSCVKLFQSTTITVSNFFLGLIDPWRWDP